MVGFRARKEQLDRRHTCMLTPNASPLPQCYKFFAQRTCIMRCRSKALARAMAHGTIGVELLSHSVPTDDRLAGGPCTDCISVILQTNIQVLEVSLDMKVTLFWVLTRSVASSIMVDCRGNGVVIVQLVPTRSICSCCSSLPLPGKILSKLCY